MNQLKNITSKQSKKINRKSFFLYAGSAMVGLGIISKLPFKFFQSKVYEKKPSIKIRENPNAVKRKTGEANIG